MLVAALEIHVGGPGQVRVERQHRLVARPRVEPHVENVVLAFERRAAARRTAESRRDEFLDRPLVPGVGAVVVEHRRGALDERRRHHRLAAFRAVDGGNRHAPGALARDAPVGTVRQHVEQSVAPPRGDPRHVAVDRLETGLAQRRLRLGQAHRPVEADEPLRRRQEDHRVVAAPAVRVLVGQPLAVPETPTLLERLLDVRVRVEHALAREHLDRVQEVPARAHRGIDVKAVTDAGIEVVRAVAWRRVDGARAGVERHVVSQHAERHPRVERVQEADPLHLLPLEARDRRAERQARDFRDLRGERFRDDHRAAAHFVRGIIELRVERDRQVGRNRPGRRGPDEDRHVAPFELRNAAPELVGTVRRQRELHVDGRRGVVFVFHLGFGQRRAAVDAPVDRLLALVDESLLDELPERARDRRLVLEVHRQVRVLPVAEDAEALELPGHDPDEPLGVRAAGAAEIRDAHLPLLRAKLAVDLQLDRQAVAVVAGNVRRVEAGHRPRLHHEILEQLVQRRPEMNLSVGVGRTVVQDELWRSLPLRPNAPVQIHRFPPRERFRLAGRQVCLHREPRTGQVECVLPVGHACKCLSA